MKILSVVFLVLALWASVVLGTQTRQWTWGPPLVLLSLSLAAATFHFSHLRNKLPAWIVILGVTTTGWFAARAWLSPVAEYGIGDILLLAAAVGSALLTGLLRNDVRTQSIFIWGLAILTLASVVVVAIQIGNPDFSFPYVQRPEPLPSGFFGHYNDGANFLIGAASILAAAGCFAKRHHPAHRVIWILIGISAVAGIYFTRSRGGILAMCVALALFFLLSILAMRKGSRWFAPAMLMIPLVGILSAWLLWKGWDNAQRLRFGSGFEEVANTNSIRLIILDLATSCIADAPLAGGGSRSFGWNCYKHWDLKAHGGVPARLEMAHNELMQAATDYGLVGAGLLLVLLVSATVRACTVLFVRKPESTAGGSRWLAIGGITAFWGMFVQSCFSFVFHLVPGTMLLGLSLGMMIWSSSTVEAGEKSAKSVWSRFTLAPAMLLAAVAIFLAGGIRSLAAFHVAPVFTKNLSPWETATRMGDAIGFLPLPSLLRERAIFLHKIAQGDDPAARDARELAVANYAEAARGNPYDPTISLNRAKLLAYLERDDEAEIAFADTIRNQGNGEGLFLGYSRRAEYLLEKGLRQLAAGDSNAAMDSFARGVADVETVKEIDPSVIPAIPQRRQMDADLHENLGFTLEEAGDFEEALKYYHIAANNPIGSTANYRAAILLSRMATAAWEERRPEEALRDFLDAKGRSGGPLPKGVTPEDRATFVAYLEKMITFMQGANITPKEQRNY